MNNSNTLKEYLIQKQGLSHAQWKVADQLSLGLSNKEIAQNLTVTIKTVKMHLIEVYKKMNIRSRNEFQAKIKDIKQKTTKLEVNGPANILMLLEMYKEKINPELSQKIQSEAEKTIKYMRQVDALNTKFWHEINESDS